MKRIKGSGVRMTRKSGKLIYFAVLLAVLGALPPRSGFALKRTAVGEPLKDFALHTMQEEPLRLMEALGGKATLVVFWATWSPRSAEALRDFQELYATHGSAGLQVIGVNTEHQEWTSGDLEKVAAYLGEQRVEFPVLLDKNLTVFDQYGVIALPSTLLADAQGRILDLLEGYSYMTRFDFRDRILKELGVLADEDRAESEQERGYLPKGKSARHYQMGMLLQKKKMFHNAIRAFLKAVEEDPEYAEAYLRLAETYEVVGSSSEAAEARARAEAIGTASAGEVSETVGAPEPEHEGSAERTPSMAAVRYVRMGGMLLAGGQPSAASEVFRKAIEADPGYPEAYLGLAKALEGDGKAEEAAQARAKAASLDRGIPSAAPVEQVPTQQNGGDQ